MTTIAALDTIFRRRVHAHAGHRVVSCACMLVTLGAAFARPMIGLAQQPQATPPPDVHEHVSVTAQLLTPTRETSGTAWLPQATPMYGVHRPWRGWDLRLNGVVFLQATYEPGDRHRTGGASTRQGGSINWGMFMARRNLGGGRVGVRTMFSAEPWTVPGCGSLNYLATGEVCDGDTIHDRQQPHDLFMELAVDYAASCTGRGDGRCMQGWLVNLHLARLGTRIACPRWPTRSVR